MSKLKKPKNFRYTHSYCPSHKNRNYKNTALVLWINYDHETAAGKPTSRSDRLDIPFDKLVRLKHVVDIAYEAYKKVEVERVLTQEIS